MGSLRAAAFELDRLGDALAIAAGDGELGWRPLAERVTAAGQSLRERGVAVGDRIAVFGPSTLSTVVNILGIQWAGAIAVPLNPLAAPRELVHVLTDSGAARVLVEPAWRGRIEQLALATTAQDFAVHEPVPVAPPVPLDDEATALLIYTSGTTGPSKGVALPWRALCSNMLALGGAWGFGPDDVLSLMLPLFHVHGLCIGIYGALLHGTAVRLHVRFDAAAVVEDFREQGATVFMGVPTMYVKLLELLEREPEHAAALARARLFTAGSAALPAAVLERFEQLTGHRILERYGMTETLITLSNPLHGERRAGSVGSPVDGVQVRIVDDTGAAVLAGDPGELRVRGSSLMLGYWNNPAATAAAFDGEWFCTGDVAVADPDGRIRIVGRTSTDIVKSGGFKISTREIEDVLREHPAVADVAVIGCADAKWGERVVAVVVPHAEPPSRQQLAEHCRTALAEYKTPRQLVLVDELPRNQMGKLEKAKLRERIEHGYVGDVDLRVHAE